MNTDYLLVFNKKICVHLVYINVGIQFPSSPISARKMPAAICQ